MTDENGSRDTDSDRRQRFRVRHALAGLQAGVLGALLIFLCLMIGSLWNGRSIWVIPNLFASTFFGNAAYRNQLLRTTWTGIALIVTVYGLLGALWGLFWGERRSPDSGQVRGGQSWLRLYGAIAGLLVYLLFFDFVWRHVNPLVTLYAPSRQLEVGHVLWGIMLARSPAYARRIADSSTPPPVVEEPVQEISSGEVIR